ncbi:MAG: helical backbone metal receptor [Saprospiraceae bacterium]
MRSNNYFYQNSDQTGRTIALLHKPKRIVSTVPSITELLCDIGLDEQLVGRTKFCDSPQELVQKIPAYGGTKNLRVSDIIRLNPDLMISNKEENTASDITQLAEHIPVWVSDIHDLNSAIYAINEIGAMCGVQGTTTRLTSEIIKHAADHSNMRLSRNKRACYLIWKNPYMTVGSDTFIHQMMSFAGFDNIFGDCQRYPVTTIHEIVNRSPEVILLSSEPYPFKESDQKLFEGIKAIFVNGKAFSWYGSRIAESFSYFCHLNSLL